MISFQNKKKKNVNFSMVDSINHFDHHCEMDLF